MTRLQTHDFITKLCPHRGVGEENTLEAIKQGIIRRPYMVEFDVQLYDHRLHLGHPPKVNRYAVLEDALDLYGKTLVMPKIDLKVTSENYHIAVMTLLQTLGSWESRRVLVNIDGDMDAVAFMEAETLFAKNASKFVELNVDLIRYKNISRQHIDKHIKSLAKPPMSLSPNLDSDIADAINFTQQHGIGHIHFWSFYNRQYSLEYLIEAMEQVLSSGLEVYFDIKMSNIQQRDFQKLPLAMRTR